MNTLTKTKWKDEWYVQCYQFAKAGMDNRNISKTLGLKFSEFQDWVKKKKALGLALKQGRSKENPLQNYIVGRLSERAQAALTRMLKAEKEKNAIRRVEQLFDKYGTGVRKEIFLHCFLASNYNPTQACRRVGIPYNQFKQWCIEDWEFATLIAEMGEHKGFFYEEKLNKLVDDLEPSAVIFANKTYNKDKGFSEKVEINHTGEIKNTHILELGPEFLDRLSKGTRHEILEVMEQLQLENKEKEMVTVNAL